MIKEIIENQFKSSSGSERFLYNLDVKDLEQLTVNELFNFIDQNKRLLNSLSSEHLYKIYSLNDEIYLDSPIETDDFHLLNSSKSTVGMAPIMNGGNIYSDPHFKTDYCKVNAEYIRFVSLSFLEDHSLDVSGFQKHGDFVVIFKKLKTVFSKLMVNDARKMSHTSLYSALADIEGIEVYKENEEMLRSIITRDQELFKTEVLFIVKSDNEKDLKSRTDDILESLSIEGFSPKITTKSLNNDFKNYVFGIEPVFQRPLLFHTAMLVNSLPLHKDQLMNEGALFHSRSGREMKINTREGDSYSIAVTGRTGNGKTVFVNKMISEELDRGRKLFVIDPKRDYRKHALLRGAYIIDETINPMMFKKASSLFNMIMSKIPRRGDIELLSGKILKVIRKHSLHEYTDFFKVLEKLESEGLGDISCYFEDIRENISSNESGELSDFTYIEISSFSKQALPFILSFAFEYVTLLKDSYSLVVDEAHRVFKHNPVFLEERAREMRSQNASLITITQSYHDLISNEFGRIVADSSYHKIFFAQLVEREGGLDDFDIEQILGLQTIKGEYSEFYYKSHKYRKILRYYPTLKELEVFSSDLDQTNKMLSYIESQKQFFSISECVNQWVRNKYA
jgi:hypothetical protein